MVPLTVEFGTGSIQVGMPQKGGEFCGIYTNVECRMVIALLNRYAKIKIANYVAVADVPEAVAEIIRYLPAVNTDRNELPLTEREVRALFGECGQDYVAFAKMELAGIKKALQTRRVVFS